VGPQTAVVTLLPPAVEVAASIDDTQLGAIDVGQSAQIRVSGYPGQTFGGTVSAVSRAVDAKTHTATVRVAPTDPRRLYPGMQATITISSVRPGALVVPRDAVVGSTVAGGEATVITVDGNLAERKSVHLGELNDQLAEIVSGLSEGELVAVANTSALTTGEAVVAVTQTAEVTNAE
jgi:RND family efflux transporter MFP subunit